MNQALKNVAAASKLRQHLFSVAMIGGALAQRLSDFDRHGKPIRWFKIMRGRPAPVPWCRVSTIPISLPDRAPEVRRRVRIMHRTPDVLGVRFHPRKPRKSRPLAQVGNKASARPLSCVRFSIREDQSLREGATLPRGSSFSLTFASKFLLAPTGSRGLSLCAQRIFWPR